MIHSIAKVAEIVAAIGTSSGIAYNLFCLWSGWSFLRERRSAGSDSPAVPISILKPLKGLDPGMYGSLRSHCLQDYPEFEIIFGVSDLEDPALKFVTRLITEFPQRKIRVWVCPKNLGANTKVSNLAQMLVEARNQYVVVNDSDICVGPGYLKSIVAPLHDSKNGLVTCLYRGAPAGTMGSHLESLSISTDFCAGVLAARTLESGIRFGLGSTLAFRRSDLAAIGGFESFVNYLADDYELGKRFSENGLKVVLSQEIVETYLPAYSPSHYLSHQLRWARTVRAARFWGFAGLIFTFALPWGALTVLFSGGADWAWLLLILACGTRLSTAGFIGRVVLRDKNTLPWLWLMPLRDILAVFIWIGSFAGNTVTWRGDRFRLEHGRLVRINEG